MDRNQAWRPRLAERHGAAPICPGLSLASWPASGHQARQSRCSRRLLVKRIPPAPGPRLYGDADDRALLQRLHATLLDADACRCRCFGARHLASKPAVSRLPVLWDADFPLGEADAAGVVSVACIVRGERQAQRRLPSVGLTRPSAAAGARPFGCARLRSCGHEPRSPVFIPRKRPCSALQNARRQPSYGCALRLDRGPFAGSARALRGPFSTRKLLRLPAPAGSRSGSSRAVSHNRSRSSSVRR